MTPQLPSYTSETLAGLPLPELIGLMVHDEDRVPRSVIDECAQRGEEIVRALEELAGSEHFWTDGAALGDWWLRLHAVMILGLVPSASAGLLLVRIMRRMTEVDETNLQDWLAGSWPALFRNKPQPAIDAARELSADRALDWYIRAQAAEVCIAAGHARGRDALESVLDWLAGLAAGESEDWTLRCSLGNTLLDFPRPRHRSLLEDLAARQTGFTVQFSADDVKKAYAVGRDKPDWVRFDDPWEFYAPAKIAGRQRRWAKEDVRAEAKRDADDDPRLELFEPHTKPLPKIGRNDPCPCGSGKKYKRCCLAKPESAPVGDLAWRRLRQLLDEWQRDMLRFVNNAYGRVAVEEAWRYFASDDEARFDPESQHIQLFMPWFYHRWSPDAEESSVRDKSLHGAIPGAEYLSRKKRIDPLLREYVESCLASPFSAFEILRADAGRGMRMKDLFTGGEHEVNERSASNVMRAGDIVFGQVASAGGVTLLEAAQGFAIPPIWKIKVLELKQARFPGASAVTAERLRSAEDSLLVLYHDIAEHMFARRTPAMQNTDGEPLSLRKVVYEIDSAQQAFDALKHLSLDDTDEELLHDAVRDAAGNLVRVNFSWLKRGNAQNPAWENTILGSIAIETARLMIDVNSAERENAIRAIVARRLGGRARYRATEIQSVEKLLADAPAGGGRNEGSELADHPEVRAKISEMMAKHYEHWVNESIPALGGKTPLAAVRDRDGREAVKALVRQIERDGERMKPPLDPEIVRSLRQRLGIAKGA